MMVASPVLNIYKPLNVDYKPNGREQLQTCGSDTHDVTRNRGYGIPAARR